MAATDIKRHRSPRTRNVVGSYALGDCVGKGAFGVVYKGLHKLTGETVALKEIRISNLSTSELSSMTEEIRLLKNLNHPNIVKYKGYLKNSSCLYIILEFCESGSLYNIYRKYGRIPEDLVALYISQVLTGLNYLHSQGVIHRDIKGANILTTKDGQVKLADFGVATHMSAKTCRSMVGTPNWMAPEVIELEGPSSASDIWSVGCTIIELLDGAPPYSNLEQMATLYAIVNSEHPPFPENSSRTVQDFLLQCFQRDPNLRVSAKKLLKHPWILKALASSSGGQTKYADPTATVKNWNNAIKAAPNPHVFKEIDPMLHIQKSSPTKPVSKLDNHNKEFTRFIEKDNESEFDKDFDFSGSQIDILKRAKSRIPNIDEIQARLRDVRILGERCSQADARQSPAGKLQKTDNQLSVLKNRVSSSSSIASRTSSAASLIIPTSRNRAVDLAKYADDKEDDFVADFASVSIQKGELSGAIAAKLSEAKGCTSNDPYSAESEDYDPFAFLNDDEMSSLPDKAGRRVSLERNQQVKLSKLVRQYAAMLSANSGKTDDDIHTLQQLLSVLKESSDSTREFIKGHGLIILSGRLETSAKPQFLLSVLGVLQYIVSSDPAFAERFCESGCLPSLYQMCTRERHVDVQRESAALLYNLCSTSDETKRLLKCSGGMNVILSLAERNFQRNPSIVELGITMISKLFENCTGSQKSEIWFSIRRYSLLPTLLAVLNTIESCHSEGSKKCDSKLSETIGSILCIAALTDDYLKRILFERHTIRELLKCFEISHGHTKAVLLKVIKTLTMSPNILPALQSTDTVEILVQSADWGCAHLNTSTGKEFLNYSVHALYNMCRINYTNLDQAISSGLIPIMQKVLKTDHALRELAIPLLLEVSHSNLQSEEVLMKHDLLKSYIELLANANWRTTALEVILEWMQRNFDLVEQQLLADDNIQAIISAFQSETVSSLERFLEPLRQILSLSAKISCALCVPEFLQHLMRRLKHNKANVKLNLLRILKLMY
ncbi:hypothetical protein CANCADRAFT_42581 [Tortispora caseinolytica NRRL Y-17796]|uniref:non-specific serine/threonine protein kinase n=1 Tax=Tortispora caseinolytica NRRL Y-17796 TaxID=767744 RepID=A0A1E4TJM1_9ASCO|nr:hypothetical protein CANCADRAFT_42581 [Tortispora caseinolytica NRRL Y-17796]